MLQQRDRWRLAGLNKTRVRILCVPRPQSPANSTNTRLCFSAKREGGKAGRVVRESKKGKALLKKNSEREGGRGHQPRICVFVQAPVDIITNHPRAEGAFGVCV